MFQACHWRIDESSNLFPMRSPFTACFPAHRITTNPLTPCPRKTDLNSRTATSSSCTPCTSFVSRPSITWPRSPDDQCGRFGAGSTNLRSAAISPPLPASCRNRFTRSAPKAKPVLIEHGYAPQDFAERRLRHNELTEIGIRHSLFVADIHTRVMLLTRSGPITLAHWQEGSALWDSVVPRRDDPAIPIRPDAYFILKQADRPEGKNKFHIFLEADRSTMSHERMAAKIAGYLAYYEQEAYRKKYPGMRSFIVATVTQSRQRADELRKDLHPLIPHAASRDAYLFIPFEDLALTSLLPKAAGTSSRMRWIFLGRGEVEVAALVQ